MPATSLTSPKQNIGTISPWMISPKEGQTVIDNLKTNVHETASLQPSPLNLTKDLFLNDTDSILTPGKLPFVSQKHGGSPQRFRTCQPSP